MTAAMTSVPTPGGAARRRLWDTPALLFVLPPLFWSGNFVVGRTVAGEISPVSLGFLRWAVALLILLPFTVHGLVRHRTVLRRHWRIIFLCGAAGVAGFNTLTYVALETTATANAVIVASFIPLAIPLFAWLICRDRVTARQGLAIFVSLTGVAWILGRGDPRQILQLQVHPGDLWMLAAVACWAIYSVILRFRPAGLPPLVFLQSTIIAGTAAILPFWIWDLMSGAVVPICWEMAAAVGYVATLPSIVAFLAWTRCVELIGPTQTGLSIHLMPVLAASLAWVALGEPLQGFHAVGAVLVFTGIGITLVRLDRPAGSARENR